MMNRLVLPVSNKYHGAESSKRMLSLFLGGTTQKHTAFLTKNGHPIFCNDYPRGLQNRRIKRSFGLVDSYFSTSNNYKDEGERYYEQALTFLQQKKEKEEREEETKAMEQYQAMLKKQETTVNNDHKSTTRAAGVAVVKTISRQTRQKQKQDQKEKEDDANFCMQMAAFQYGHSNALVRLGNQAYREANLSLQSSTSQDSDIYYQKEFMNSPIVDMKYLQSLSFIHQAIYLYQLAATQQHPEAYYNLGNIYWNGFPQTEHNETNDIEYDPMNDGTVKQVPKDIMKAMDAFYHAIQLGDVDAKYFVGVTLLWSTNRDEDNVSSFWKRKIPNEVEATIQQQGLKLIQDAAYDGHHEGALYYLAMYYRNGDERFNLPPCTEQEFRSRLDKAADAGDVEALFTRAHCYYHGEDGYEQNSKAALKNYIQAAKAGNSNAAISAAVLHYRMGDKRKAFEYYQEAAEMGNIEGWRNLVSCYALGEGIPPCRTTAEYIAKTMLADEATNNDNNHTDSNL